MKKGVRGNCNQYVKYMKKLFNKKRLLLTKKKVTKQNLRKEYSQPRDSRKKMNS